MKKILLFLVFALLPMVASADKVEIDGIYYNLIPKGKAAEVTSNPNKYSGEVVIPSSVTYNGVEYSVTSIGSSTFFECYNLTSITIPNSVTYIGHYAFQRCTGLTSITIPNSVTSIGNYAFEFCLSLTSVTIPNSVTSIGDGAFSTCNSLNAVYISDLAAWFQISFPNSYSNPLYYAHHLFLNGEEIKDLVIPNSVTSIGQYAFYNCSSLTSITIPNSVTSIGRYAFNSCTSLTSVTIPNSVTSIGYYAFNNCSNLTSIIVESGNTVYDSRGNCNAIIETTTNTLIRGCENTIIPNSVTSIGDYAFYGCSSLTSITIPNSVTSIGQFAFAHCTSLTSITIGSGVKKIKSYAFGYCPELTDVYCYAVNVPQTVTDAFVESKVEYATLHVPDESLQAYKETEPWSQFGTIVGLSGGTPVTPETPKCATPTISYDDDNKKLTFGCETEGVEYVYSITDTDVKQGYDAEVTLTATYEISVYATKAGYENSDVATATLVWGSATFTDTTPATAIEIVPAMEAAMPVLIQNNGGMLTVQGAQDGTPVSVYTTAGTEAGSAVSQNSMARISTSMQQGDIAIVRLGNRSVKVVLK